MEVGEPEVHTTALTAFSAADQPDNHNSNNVNMEDELTTPSTNQELDSVNDQLLQRPVSPRQVGANPAPFFKVASGSAVAPPSLLPRQPAPFFPSVPVTMPSAAASAVDGGVAEASSPSFSSTYSLFPPSSSTSSLDFTAAWVASTPFSDAATPLPTSVSPPIVGSGFFDQRPPHFLAPKVAIVAPSLHSSSASSMSTASMLSSSSFGKPRPATTSLIRIEQSKQMQHEMLRQKLQRLQEQQKQQRQNQDNASSDVVMDGPRQTTLSPSQPPQFITPSYGVNNINKSHSAVDAFVAQPPFFVPSINAGGDCCNGNNGAGSKLKYPLYNRQPAAMTTNHLGRHWKQMGSQTRQYLQPSIPLPPSSRIASAAAKQLRGASLGGPPGSSSPLTPNKSWAQVVASTPQQNKQPTSSVVKEGSDGDNKKQQQQQQQSAGKAGGVMAPPPPPPPLVAPTKPTRSASLRGLSGLGGIATSSNRDFKSLLLRLKTALDKERDKWRPRDGRTGKDVVVPTEGNESEEVITIDGQPTVVCIHGEAPPSVTINGKHRDDCIFWLGWIVRKLRFSEETLALSATLFDAVVTAISSAATASMGGEAGSLSVTPENCQLVALVCLSLSAKFSEEDADVPTTKDLLTVSDIGVYGSTAPSPSDGYRSGETVSLEATLKMERVLLTVLEWDLNRPSPLRFLEILHTLLMCHQPQLLEEVALGLTPAKHLERLTWKMQKIVACHQLAQTFRPAVLAVALLSVDLESIGVSDWQIISATLEKICQIGDAASAGGSANNNNNDRHKLARCKNLIVRVLAGDRNAGVGAAAPAKGSGGGRKASPAAEAWSETPEKKRTMTKLKRKHVPSESGGGMTDSATLSTAEAASTSTTSSSTGSTSSLATLKRVFSIAESPTCKSEARSEEEAAAARGGIAAERFAALQGLCINIY